MYKEINEVEERIKQLEETIEYLENKDKQFDVS
jgi:polyhydroxyalkanoate synthesis regulator phasin